MSINIEKVDLLMERANIGYKEAYELLQQHDGSVIEALVHLEKNQQTKAGYQQTAQAKSDTLDNIHNFISETHQKRFVISNNERTVVDLPLTVAGIAGVIALPVALPLIGLGLITGHKINIDDREVKVDNTCEEACTATPNESTSDNSLQELA